VSCPTRRLVSIDRSLTQGLFFSLASSTASVASNERGTNAIAQTSTARFVGCEFTDRRTLATAAAAPAPVLADNDDSDSRLRRDGRRQRSVGGTAIRLRPLRRSANRMPPAVRILVDRQRRRRRASSAHTSSGRFDESSVSIFQRLHGGCCSVRPPASKHALNAGTRRTIIISHTATLGLGVRGCG
jgi:hypothetical protein